MAPHRRWSQLADLAGLPVETGATTVSIKNLLHKFSPGSKRFYFPLTFRTRNTPLTVRISPPMNRICSVPPSPSACDNASLTGKRQTRHNCSWGKISFRSLENKIHLNPRISSSADTSRSADGIKLENPIPKGLATLLFRNRWSANESAALPS